MPIATLDACVLYKGMLTDLLLWIASQSAFEPTWSDLIHDEWVRNLAERISEEKLSYRKEQMDRAFPGACTPANAVLLTNIQASCRTKAHKKDAHVIETAVSSQAQVIVTFNIKDFDATVLQAYQIQKMKPDDFLLDLLSNSQAQVLSGVKAHRASLRRTTPTVDEYLAEISGAKGDVSRFATALQAHKESI